MAFNITQFTQKMNKLQVLCTVDSMFRLRFVRFQSILAKKLVYSEYGDPSKVVQQVTQTLPDPGSNEIVVRMLAAPVNPADINTIQGVYAVVKPKLPSIPGNEGSFKPGDRVLPKGIAWGTWRTHAVCDAKEMIKVSSDIGIVEAATMIVNPCTAYRMLKDFVQLSKGDTVIQNGANSACGQNVIQICKAWGITSVNIVRNRENIDELKAFLTDLGATHVLTEEELRTTQLFKTSQILKPKLALNCVGGKNALDCLRQLDRGGVMVTYGGMSREPVTVPTSALIFKDVVVRGYWMTQWSKDHLGSKEQKEMFEEIMNMYKQGHLRPPIHRLIPFSNYKEALENTINPKGFVGLKYIIDFQVMQES
ncbi:hypothetical protein L9F63_002920 [Diploptera punctata]|uniref:Enoyl-[acyl-carrier-protein] reductase, mitochondrial n=1 Tax=Diploptera punctata TaxID=6984 RepID=A0AAD7ZR18_DIPPU|nr:hypothetical protein L9F63_002920 [Diploptera punctata]